MLLISARHASLTMPRTPLLSGRKVMAGAGETALWGGSRTHGQASFSRSPRRSRESAEKTLVRCAVPRSIPRDFRDSLTTPRFPA